MPGAFRGRFVAIPEVPTAGLEDFQQQLFNAMKEDIELLSGTRGETDTLSRSVIRGDVTVAQVGRQELVSITSVSPEGFVVSSVDVAALTAHRALKNDVQFLANDLFQTRRALDLLIRNITGA